MKKRAKILSKKSHSIDSFVSVVKNKKTRIGEVLKYLHHKVLDCRAITQGGKGRTMLEMLAVLGIMAVLALGMAAGLRYALDKIPPIMLQKKLCAKRWS